jgi:hypothetical protein
MKEIGNHNTHIGGAHMKEIGNPDICRLELEYSTSLVNT